jgi:hypothetical protein
VRRPRREIEIFSMSVLDMFASALGAFIMASIILFPYYKQDIKSEISSVIESLENKRGELQSVSDSLNQQLQRNVRQQALVEEVREEQARTRRCLQELAVCTAELSQTFLMVMMEWTDSVDADLYVTDPQGNEFSWQKSNRTGTQFPGTQAQLSFDVTEGPGIEVWLSPMAGPGDYKVDYKLARRYARSVSVSGYYIDRTGRRPLPTRMLSDDQLRVRAAIIRMVADGKIVLIQ